jgi:hypothetical protein
LLGFHFILEDYRAYDNGDGGAEIAGEAEGGCCSRDITFLGGLVSNMMHDVGDIDRMTPSRRGRTARKADLPAQDSAEQ